MRPASSARDPTKSLSRVLLPLPFPPSKPHLSPGLNTKSKGPKSFRPPRLFSTPVSAISFFVFRSLEVKSIEAERVCALRYSSSFNSPISSPARSMRAFCLVVRALGPRLSHSVSRRTMLRMLSSRAACTLKIASRFFRKSL
jgi:hypothetical protein